MRRVALLVLAVAAVVLSACEARVSTHVTLRSPDSVEVEVEVVLTDAAAEVFSADLELLRRLERLIEDRAASTVKREVTAERITFRAQVTPEAVAAASTLTGIGEVTVAPAGEHASVTVPIVAPTALAAALAETPDEFAVPVLLKYTTVNLEVRTGDVMSVSGLSTDHDAGIVVSEEDGTVLVTRTAGSTAAGTLVVVATPLGGGAPIAVIVAMFVALGVAVWAIARRRR